MNTLSGLAHYGEAEYQLAMAEDTADPDYARQCLAAAHAHATLALAAAMALNAINGTEHPAYDELVRDWDAVLGAPEAHHL